MRKTAYTLQCHSTSESQTVIACDGHAPEMPQADGELVTAVPADDDVGCDFCRQRAAPGCDAVEILLSHEPPDRLLPAGWQALAPGAASGCQPTPWRAIAAVIWAWHCAGRPRGGIAFVGEPHPTAAGTVAQAVRTAWAATCLSRMAA